MKIAQVTATFPPYWGGTGNVCYYNSRELARRGHQVHVYTASLPGAPAEELLEGVHIHRLRPLFRFGNAPFLLGLMNLRGFDLIHLHHPFIFGSEMIRMVSVLRRIPYLLTHHNDLIGTGIRNRIFQVYSALVVPIVFADAWSLITVSKDHANHCRLGALFSRHPAVFEVPNGVDPEIFQPLPICGQVRESLAIPADVPLCVFNAALDRAHHFKGLEVLLQGLAKPELNMLHLLVIGDGDLKSHYQALAVELNIQLRIHFAGKIAHTKLPPYLTAGDFLILPSLPPESFGMVLIEALACGLPVIASDIPGVRRVVTEGIDGFLVKPNNVHDLVEKIVMMLALPREKRRIMGIHGQEKVVNKYTWKQIAEELDALYSKAIM